MTFAERLNKTVWAKIGVSKIDGVGVIALRDIQKGQRIYATPDNETTKEWFQDESFTGLHDPIFTLIKQRWPYAVKGGPFLSPNDDARLASFINHSTTPNYNPHTDQVIQNIAAGEEITQDYGAFAVWITP